MKIVKYKLAHANSPTDFAIEVNKFIENGFQPLGSVSVTSVIDENAIYEIYAQAMVKYE